VEQYGDERLRIALKCSPRPSEPRDTGSNPVGRAILSVKDVVFKSIKVFKVRVVLYSHFYPYARFTLDRKLSSKGR